MSALYGALDQPSDTFEAVFHEDDIEIVDIKGSESPQKSWKIFKRSATIATITLISIGAMAMFDVNTISSSTRYNEVAKLSVTSKSNSLTISSVSNNYGVQDLSAMLPYPFLNGSFLIEPHREATIDLAEPLDDCKYSWLIASKSVPVKRYAGISLDGTIVVTLPTVGEYTFTAAETCDDTSVSARKLDMSLWVKYVRRELSSLTEDDREEFLDAFHKLWTVSTTEGVVLYGSRYKSINYFATLHNDGGGNGVCDEFHGGHGFLNNHMYLSAYLEQSLQLVNPRVALNYMEYTKYFESAEFKTHLNNQFDTGAWTTILTSTFFGASDPITGRILDGRWANASVPMMTPEFYIKEGININKTFFAADELRWLERSHAHMSSPYGLLRSPWNYNPSPYVTRFGTVYRIEDVATLGSMMPMVFKFHKGVNCTNYKQFMTYVQGRSLETYLVSMEDDTHGIFHFTLGGVGGDVAAVAIEKLRGCPYNFTDSNIAALAVSAQHYFKKNLANSETYPLSCSTNPWKNYELSTSAAPNSLGGPSCHFDSSFYLDEDALSDLVLKFFNFDVDDADRVVDRVQNLTFVEKKGAMEIIAGMFPYDGDLAGASAALDPLFWVAHGAMERLFQRTVFAEKLRDMAYTSTSLCSGHDYAAGKTWLDGFYFTDESVVAQKVTNAELTAILDPRSVKYRDYINFVYDTDSYTYCNNSAAWFP